MTQLIFFAPIPTALLDPPWAQRKIPVDITHRIFGCSSTAIKTAFFLAECSTKQAEQPLDLAAASALRSWLAFASSGASLEKSDDTLTKNRAILCQGVPILASQRTILGDFDEKYGISLLRCHVRVEDIIIYTQRSWLIRQASCSKRLRKLSPRACFTFLCLLQQTFQPTFSLDPSLYTLGVKRAKVA